MRIILILIWIIVTCGLYIRARRKARRDPQAIRGLAAWRPMAKTLFQSALISGLIVYVGGSIALFLLNQQMALPR